MSKVEFYPDPKHIETSFLAAWNTAGILLAELVKAKGGGGAWFEELKSQLEKANLEAAPGSPLPPDFDAGDANRAYRDTVRSIFERIKFTSDPNEATHFL